MANGASGLIGGAAQGASAGLAFGGFGFGALGGAVIGGAAGLLSGVAGQRSAKRQRRRVRRGIQSGLGIARREISSVVNSPEIEAMRQFLHGLYGISPGATGRRGGLGAAQEFQGVSTVDPDAASRGTLSGQDLQAVNRATKQLAEIDRARRLSESGLELSPAEQSRIEGLLSSDTAQDVLRDIEGLSGLGQNVVARQLEEREGIGAGDFNALYGSLRESAGLEPRVAQDSGVDLSAGLDTSFNTPLGNFQKGLQQAQASRGLFASNAAAAAEGSGMAAFLFQQQQTLLPALQNLASMDVGALAQSIEANRINQQVALSTGGASSLGPNPLDLALQGGLSGLFAGGSIGLNAGGLFGQQQPQQQQQPTAAPRQTNQFLQQAAMAGNPQPAVPTAASLANDFSDSMFSSANLFPNSIIR